jgi:GGDEF domain-containing protein
MLARSGPRRPRPLADPVVAALAARADDVARRWLVALVEDRALEDVAALPVAELATAGPPLCQAVLEAVGSDPALDALAEDAVAGDHAARFARLAGGGGGPALVAAAEALRRAALEAAEDELPRSESPVLADLSDRLAHVCAHLAATAMARAPEAATDGDLAAAPQPVDLLRTEPDEPADSAPLWLAALERRLADGGRFALLLVELDGADRLRLAEGEQAARELFVRAGRAVRGALRRVDLLAHEDDGRMWVIAPDAARAGAGALADRVGVAVESAASARGVPLTASIGIALFPGDGRDAAALTGHAEETALAARAAGVRVAGEPDDRPFASGPRLVH